MDDSTRTSIVPVAKRRYRSFEEKLQIIQEALAPGVSVAAVARAHAVNANMVFHWRKLYRAGVFAKPEATGVRLLPVKIEGGKKQKQRRIARSATEEAAP